MYSPYELQWFCFHRKNILVLIYSKLHSHNVITNILKVFYKLSKVTDVFTQFLIFSRKLIRKDKDFKGEGGKADLKATKFRFSLITYQDYFPKMSLTQILPIKSVHLVFAGVLNLICFSWLVDKLHFLSCYFSFLNCSVTMPVSSV